MLIRIANHSKQTYEIRSVTRWQLEDLFKTMPDLEKVDVLKISRVITRRKVLG